jgi:signal transduction histidine kinase
MTRLTFQKTALWLGAIMAISLVILVGFWLMSVFEPHMNRWTARFLAALVTVGALLVFIRGLLTVFPMLLKRMMPVPTYDSNRVLREFSVGISSINDPSTLASTAIGLISEAVEFQRGCLFEVEHEASPSPGTYRLTMSGGMGQVTKEQQNGVFATNSPIAQFFRQERNPISNEELLHSSRFAHAAQQERTWLAGLNMVLFVPIHTKQDWIGLIALGAKASGARYATEEILLISTLADQLSLALQNARLIASLMRVNNDFRRAYTSMEQSNRHLQQAINQLEKMDETKSDFISVASHELRTPLTVMRGYTEMLVDDPALQSNSLHQKMLRGIHAGILRLHEIVESMLDVASIDSRSLSLHKKPLAVGTIIHSIANSLKDAVSERHLELVLENLRDLPLIEADDEALNKVFYQVLINAIKYTPDGGTITIHGLTVSPGQAGLVEGGIEIIISDTGIGIDPANQELIFRKFYQTGKVSLHSTGKTKYKGSGPGLGLAIAKGIIDAHDGRIWVESERHDEESMPGSQFHIILPYA